MKMKILQVLFYSVLSVALVSCVNEDEVNQERSGSVGTPRLDVVVTDSDGNPVSGATVDFYASADDYANEENSVKTVATDASGVASLEAGDVDGVAGQYYFNVASGSLRNWIDVTSAPYLYWSSGPTVVTTQALTVIQEFLDLTAGDFIMSSYTYPGAGNVLTGGCADDDIYTFRKDGVIIRKEGATVCATPGADQSPVSVEGAIWGTWSVSADGANITMRDLDPAWESANDPSPGLTTSATQIIIDYGSGYVATLDLQ